MARHRSHSIEFKRQVAQEFVAGETLYALAKRHDLSRQLIRVWWTSSKSPRRIDFAQPRIPSFSALPHPHTPIEGWWGSGECPACTTSAPPRLGKVGQGLLPHVRLSLPPSPVCDRRRVPAAIRAGCCRRHAPQIHKPSARVSFGLPDPLSFQARSHAMVARRSGTNTRQGKRQGQAAKQWRSRPICVRTPRATRQPNNLRYPNLNPYKSSRREKTYTRQYSSLASHSSHSADRAIGRSRRCISLGRPLGPNCPCSGLPSIGRRQCGFGTALQTAARNQGAWVDRLRTRP